MQQTKVVLEEEEERKQACLLCFGLSKTPDQIYGKSLSSDDDVATTVLPIYHNLAV